MNKENVNSKPENELQKDETIFHLGLSVDCVIFGFHQQELKVLLLKMKHTSFWALPGGFVYKEEEVESAAIRVLEARTGLTHIFLQQFYVFSDPKRSQPAHNQEILEKRGIPYKKEHWFLQRFVTIGFYALVDFTRTVPQSDSISDACQWWDLQKIPELMMDHGQILNKALDTLRLQLNYQPIGYNLLPTAFTMPQLQKLYETLLNKKLDRRNFHRKMLAYNILERLPERLTGVAHKAPYLYRFNLDKYQQALRDGLQGGW